MTVSINGTTGISTPNVTSVESIMFSSIANTTANVAEYTYFQAALIRGA
jgi:hypothetical protein